MQISVCRKKSYFQPIYLLEYAIINANMYVYAYTTDVFFFRYRILIARYLPIPNW